MKRAGPWLSSVLALLGGQVAAMAAADVQPPVDARPGAVGVVAASGSRLAVELKRELEISAFHVSLMPGPRATGDWREHARALVMAGWPRVVALSADERSISVLSLSSSAGGVQASLDLQLDPDDRLSRRRACLTVVEYLRVLVEAADQPVPQQPPEPAPAIAQAQDPVTSAPDANATKTASDLPSLPATPGSTQPGTMGVGTTLDFSRTWGQPAGHLQFMWYFPLSKRLSLRARAQWPLLGLGFQSGGTDIRMWTFGAAIGLQFVFREPRNRWRPFLGVSVGNRIVLTEASSDQPLQTTRTAVTPSATLSLEAGIRYAVGPRVQLFTEIEGARDWMVPTTNRQSYETQAANALSFHASLGVLFEY